MNMLNELGIRQGRESTPADRLPKYDRGIFDYIIIGMGYLLMPLGLLLALIRFLTTHYKNYRKPSNHALLFHVFVGGFVEMTGFMMLQLKNGEMDLTAGSLIGVLLVYAAFFLIPASIFARNAAKARYQFRKLANKYMELITVFGVKYTGDLADRTGQSQRDVDRDLLYLQKYGVLAAGSAVANQGGAASAGPYAAQSVSSGFSGAAGGQAQTGGTSQSPPQMPKSERCPGCGAQNTVFPGQPKRCDYCGTTISYS
ncbi:hypothetical protein C2I18_05575 [Paenibacillus sp. PK3_47]|uniref:hypothetical protein n=1 Tax=Paenibacillus sp. PK3_47 TaxID=2072642 RepID=UPI00201D34BC|nr:hypothetical protein [Paenibacillus sp. PK3_47]UQZ33073.1 hypothetical protein C2I18_05575 [Paenibacillus sp. PK3_47]